MTCLQLLIESGILDAKVVQERFKINVELSLDSEGGCKMPLSNLLVKE
jgi:hypothetical protein